MMYSEWNPTDEAVSVTDSADGRDEITKTVDVWSCRSVRVMNDNNSLSEIN